MKIPIFLALNRMYAKINSLIHEMRYFKPKNNGLKLRNSPC